MSWDSYVDNLLQSGNVTHAALLGIDGSIWAKDAGCKLTQEEATAIAGGMGEVSGKYFQDNGCVLGGEKYFCLRMVGDEGLFYGKKGPSGLCIARSTQCLVVGVYGEGQTPGACNIAVEGMKRFRLPAKEPQFVGKCTTLWSTRRLLKMSSSLLKKAAANTTGMMMPPPAPFRRAPASSGGSSEVYTPIEVKECFDETFAQQIDDDTFQIYRSNPVAQGEAVPGWMLLVHGAGCCAMSWGLCAKELKAKGVPVISFDMRGHGLTACTDETDLSVERLSQDIVNVMDALFKPGDDVIIVGHSLGGALAVRVAKRTDLKVNLRACGVVDVVEGTALDSLRHMKTILARKPASFSSISRVVQWGLSGHGVKNLDSARASMPPLVRRMPEGGAYVWRTDLLSTEPFWKGWFEGMGECFLDSACPKLLLTAGTDRLDKELSIAHMQGRFQLSMVYGTGHYMQEDKPQDVAQILAIFFQRFTAALPTSSNMSWDSYVDNLLQSGNVTHAALLGIDGSIWAKDAGCKLTQEEATAIAGGMGEVSGKYFQDNGCVLGGEKYFCLRMVGDEGLFYGKKGPSGLCIARSTQCLVVGVYGEGQTPGACNIAVEGMKDYLVGAGY
ncbi:putative protein phosphatase methylesterase 1 [Diplonema papillatum]|nr:putative protein phosphatase methylesterase 1 [Diplonema papillatum]